MLKFQQNSMRLHLFPYLRRIYDYGAAAWAHTAEIDDPIVFLTSQNFARKLGRRMKTKELSENLHFPPRA